MTSHSPKSQRSLYDGIFPVGEPFQVFVDALAHAVAKRDDLDAWYHRHAVNRSPAACADSNKSDADVAADELRVAEILHDSAFAKSKPVETASGGYSRRAHPRRALEESPPVRHVCCIHCLFFLFIFHGLWVISFKVSQAADRAA